MRTSALVLTLMLGSATAAAAQDYGDDPDKAVQGGGELPSGWMARTDRDASLENARVVMEEGNLRVTLGPALILWRAGDTVSGDFEAGGTFHQFSSGQHAESYGILIGGSDLADPSQAYTYFLIRGDGKYLVVQRDSTETRRLVSEWTASDAIHPADTSGHALNELQVESDGKTVRFLVNDTEVYSVPASEIHSEGIVGLRINHNLDVRVDDYEIDG